MAKRTKKTSETASLTTKDKKTLGSIHKLADGVVQSAERGFAAEAAPRPRDAACQAALVEPYEGNVAG